MGLKSSLLTSAFVGATLLAGMVLLAGPARAAIVTCGTGNSITQALQGNSNIITIKGVCTENVDIERRDVTLEGDGGEIVGTVTIAGASRVVIKNLTIRDAAGDGVDILGASAVEIYDTTISSNDGGCGVFVGDASFLRIENSFILGHNISGLEQLGLCVNQGSVVQGKNNHITDNSFGVIVIQRGTYFGRGEEIVSIVVNSAMEVAVFSYLELRDSSVGGRITFTRQSHGSIRDTFISDQLRLLNHSYVQTRGETDCTLVGFDSTSEYSNFKLATDHHCDP